MLKIKHGTSRPEKLIDISGLEELRYIREDDGLVRIGACTTLCTIESDKLLKEVAPLISSSAMKIASTEIRNVGTIGGNLCCAQANCGICFLPGCKKMTGDRSIAPCRNAKWSDLLLPLAAYDAEAIMESCGGQRIVKVEHFIKDSGAIDIKHGELLREIRFNRPSVCGCGFAELREPSSMGFPYLSVTALSHDEKFDITVGGSTTKIFKFINISKTDIADIAKTLTFCDSLQFSKEYRNDIAASIIMEAIDTSIGGNHK